METDTINRPKINKTTFKLGSGLSSQVAKNTEKLTILRRLVTRQDAKISESITPRINVIQESLIQTNFILTDVATQLEKDFSSRLQEQRELLKRRRGDRLSSRRENLEDVIEAKKTQKTVTNVASKTVKPMQGIFGGLKNFLLLLGGGLLIKTLLDFSKLNPGLISKRLRQAYDAIKKHMGLIVNVGKTLVAIGLGVVIFKIVKAIAALIAVLANPLLLAGVGILIAAGSQGLGKGEKEVLAELQSMGGPTEDNRKLLIEKLKQQKSNLNPLEILQGVGSENNERIKFLETGEYGYGKKFSFDVPLVPNFIQNPMPEMKLDFDDEDAVSEVLKDLPPIDMREEKRERSLDPGGGATSVSRVVSHNVNNNYMKEVPSLFGFGDLVYT